MRAPKGITGMRSIQWMMLATTLMSGISYADKLTTDALQVPDKPLDVTKTVTVAAAPNSVLVIDCNYPISASQHDIDHALLSTWAQKAARQAFEFNADQIDTQLNALKACFTTQGWQGFSDALKASSNVDVIKTHHLIVSSQINGDVNIEPIKDNQWKITIPMHIVYKNDKELLTQQLSVNLLVGRNPSGTLGIMQLIASPIDTKETPAATTSAAQGM
jgi:hypothetical protein